MMNQSTSPENKSSGGVVRLSISPSQGDDPGFKSRPEHFLFCSRLFQQLRQQLQILSKSGTEDENIGYRDKERNRDMGHGERDGVTLPNPVRSAGDTNHEVWPDFKNYLVGWRTKQSSIRDKVSYAKRYYHVLGKV